MKLLACLLLLAGLSLSGAASAQRFDLPLDCRLGTGCDIQNYADADAGPTAHDPACGPLSYDGHDGLDFRVTHALARAGVNVVAPAAGVVTAMRDGQPDGAYAASGAAIVENRECGNGIMIAHAEGWTSQLCHMRNGSVRVHVGDHVVAGQVVGLVGASGMAAFPHTHLTLRHNGEKVDPFTGGALTATACHAAPQPSAAIWSASALAQLSYRDGHWFVAGFTGDAPAQGANAEDLPTTVTAHSPALVFWALAIGPRQGDVLHVRLYGAGGALLAEGSRTQPRDQAQAWVFAGRRTPASGWPAGNYRGEAVLERNGAAVSRQTMQITVR